MAFLGSPGGAQTYLNGVNAHHSQLGKPPLGAESQSAASGARPLDELRGRSLALAATQLKAARDAAFTREQALAESHARLAAVRAEARAESRAGERECERLRLDASKLRAVSSEEAESNACLPVIASRMHRQALSAAHRALGDAEARGKAHAAALEARLLKSEEGLLTAHARDVELKTKWQELRGLHVAALERLQVLEAGKEKDERRVAELSRAASGQASELAVALDPHLPLTLLALRRLAGRKWRCCRWGVCVYA